MTNFASLQSWEQVGLHESVTTTTQDVIKPHKPSTTCNVFYILTINGLTLIKFKFKPPVGCVHGAVVAYYLTPHNQNDSCQEQASRLISGTDTVVTWRSVEDQSEPCAHKKLEKQLKRVPVLMQMVKSPFLNLLIYTSNMSTGKKLRA